ncbi:hypothetical protein GT044_00005, partial [Streptomyces sp. SID335]|nr:hypothetical protein [Streptomyces sp. SID335]
MTATPSQPYTPDSRAGVGSAPGTGRAQGAAGVSAARAPRPFRRRARRGPLHDTLALVTAVTLSLPLLALAVPAAFAGGGTRRWFGGRGESLRA